MREAPQNSVNNPHNQNRSLILMNKKYFGLFSTSFFFILLIPHHLGGNVDKFVMLWKERFQLLPSAIEPGSSFWSVVQGIDSSHSCDEGMDQDDSRSAPREYTHSTAPDHRSPGRRRRLICYRRHTRSLSTAPRTHPIASGRPCAASSTKTI